MLLVVADGRTATELEMQVNHPAATVADLADALGVDHDVLHLDGRRLDPDLGLDECGLAEGAVVRIGPGRHDAGRAGWWAEVVGGLDAGRRQPLTPGTHVVGRDPASSVVLTTDTVSARHAEITVPSDGAPTVRDLDSRNGTWRSGEPVVAATELAPGDTLSLGAVDLALRPDRADDRPRGIDATRHATAAGLVPFNRPPRAALAGRAEPLEPPDPPAKQGQRTPIMFVTALAPLVMAAVMVQVYGRIVFALFALMSPIMVIGGALERRRRQTTGARKEQRRYRKDLEELEAALVEREALERARLAGRVPDLAEVARRAQLPSTQLWERRPGHEDVLELRLGIGEAPWDVPIRVSAGQTPPAELAELLDRHRRLPEAPFVVNLDEGGVIGLAGHREAALAVARSLLCQAAVHHGPADLAVVVLASEDSAAAWDWAKWLPHTRDAGTGNRWLAAGREAAEALVEPLLRAGRDRDDGAGPTVLAVVDDESLLQGRRAPTRTLLRGGAGPVAGIVIASSVDRLPAMCTWVVDVRDVDGTATVHHPADGTSVDGVGCSGASDPTARDIARSLAAFEDPELAIVGAGLPDRARLLPLLGLEDVEAATLLDHWRDAGLDPPAAGVIGVDEDDVFDIDLDRDGPHGLVAGTTGAGKSELLRTLVASMAIASSPQALTFVLVDFKGGSAFDACARLPHTVGLVTDLDEHLAERALRCLEAELHHRERLLRDVGASDLVEYRKQGSPDGPLPRLLVVVDEFATLKAELPDFVESLVGVAQRGRSLGVHMILATQRPSGAVSENIRANTNLRIALRVQDGGDSNDVIGVSDAAQIPRGRPGRAYVRLGPGEVVAIQTALSTAGDAAGTVAPVEVAPFRFGMRGGPAPRPGGEATRTDLELLVDAAAGAFELSGWPAPRRPWPEPLPARIGLDALLELGPGRSGGAQEGSVPFALADDPDAQAQYPVGWDPRDGNLLLIGIPGSGVTTTVATLALSLASHLGPDELHLYALDMGAGELAPLAELPHTGAVVGAGERERQVRVIRHLRAELDRRRQLGPAERRDLPRIVLVVDGFAAFASEFREGVGGGVLEELERLVADGPEVAITSVLTGDRVGAVPARMAAVVPRKILFRLADAGDYGLAGVRLRNVPAMPPGRAFDGDTGQLVQAALVEDLPAAVAACAARAGDPASPPAPIQQLPSHVALGELPPAQVASRPWQIPVGLAEHDLEPVRLEVFEGEHVYLGGTARSGRSTMLATVATAVRSAAPDATLIGVTTPRSPLETLLDLDVVVSPDRLAEALDAADAALASTRVPVLVLIDDAELVDDTPDGRLGHLTTRSTGPVLVVAAGRNDALRANFGHWSRGMRRAKLGALLRPDLDLDGDLLGLQLPRRLPVPLEVPGRGFVVNAGRAELAQLAAPE